jgi:UDP-glucose 4-epimerase
LADAIHAVLVTPEPLRRPLIVADPEPLSVAQMIACMREGLGRKPRLVRVPDRMLHAVLSMVGRSELYERMIGRLVVDPSALLRIGWRPSAETAAALGDLVRTSRRKGI